MSISNLIECLCSSQTRLSILRLKTTVFPSPALRKLTQKSANVEGRLEKRQVIRDYTKFDSQVYAPMTRIGMYLDTGSEQYNVKSRFTNTMNGV